MPQAFIAGIDLGASNVRVIITNPDGEIEARRSSPFDGSDPERALTAIGRTVDDLVRSVWPGAGVAAIGMALPGTVDPGRGLVATAANLPGWGDVDIAAALRRGRGVPVAVENDANAAAAGEAWLGVAKAARDFVFIALGTGIGAGVWANGAVHHGAHFLGGEVAFFPMTREQLLAGGWQQNLEAVAGGRALDAAAREILGGHATAADLFGAAEAGDAAALECIASAHEYLAMAVASIIALLDPQMVVFGGGIAAGQGEALLAPVRELAHRSTPVKTPIVLSSLGKDAQVLGAVRLALDALERK